MTSKFITLPAAIAVYPALHQPDTKFDELGQWKADVKLPLAEAKPYMDMIEAIHKEHTGKAVPKDTNLWKPELDEDGKETGNIIFIIRVKNKLKKDGKMWERRPTVIDAKKQKMSRDIKVGGGSKLRVQFEPYCWKAGVKVGVSLQPTIVQVIDLVTWGDGAMSDFDEVDDGFVDDTTGPTESDFEVEQTKVDEGADY